MFIPKRILFEKKALDYEMGKKIFDTFKDREGVEIIHLSSNRIKSNIPGEELPEFYKEGKQTLVVGVKKASKFQTCKPSAHYQLPLVSGCIGECEYCYLNTNLADKPYTKVNVNVDDILNQAQVYMDERKPDITLFEGSATSDPIPVEPYTDALKKTIEFFGESELGKFRFVTKFTDIDTLLTANHKGRTEIRFTINTDKVINDFENKTPAMKKRIDASAKVGAAGYSLGYIIAPVFIYDGWKEDYLNLLKELHKTMPTNLVRPISFEIIAHRYTTRAKNVITQIFPDTTLPMVDEERRYKYGQFGYGKFVYPKEEFAVIKEFFEEHIADLFPDSELKYIV